MRVEHDGQYAAVASRAALPSTRLATTTSSRSRSLSCRTARCAGTRGPHRHRRGAHRLVGTRRRGVSHYADYRRKTDREDSGLRALVRRNEPRAARSAAQVSSTSRRSGPPACGQRAGCPGDAATMCSWLCSTLRRCPADRLSMDTAIAPFARRPARRGAAGSLDGPPAKGGPTSRRHWGFFDVPDLHAEAEQARTQVAGFLVALDGMARRYDERRAQALPRARPQAGRRLLSRRGNQVDRR